MDLYTKTDDTSTILAYDIFQLLDIKNMTDEQKEKYLQTVEKLILEHYFQEKVSEKLTKEQLQELMQKYPPDNDKNVEALIEAIGQMLPNAADLFVDATIEVKARLVKDQYESTLKIYEKMLKEAKSSNIKSELTKKIDTCKNRLAMATQQRWTELAMDTEII